MEPFGARFATLSQSALSVFPFQTKERPLGAAPHPPIGIDSRRRTTAAAAAAAVAVTAAQWKTGETVRLLPIFFRVYRVSN